MSSSDPKAFLRENGFDVCMLIGQGGFSKCFRVFSRQYKKHFVCKIITINGNKSDSFLKSFKNEIGILSKCCHPNIIQVYKTFSTDTHVYLILELCPGGDFQSYIMKHGPITNESHLIKYLTQILDAFSFLEENNISHRDIKPSNILVDKYSRPKIADFGFSAFMKGSELCSEYSGSLPYLAPEVLAKKPHNPFKADVWSFGVTLYYLVTGRHPFPMANKGVLISSIKAGKYTMPKNASELVKSLLGNSLTLDPEDRLTFTQLRALIHTDERKLSKDHHNCISSIALQSSIFPRYKVGRLRSVSSIITASTFPEMSVN